MVKILYLIMWETSDKSYCVYVPFDSYLFGFFWARNIFFLNHYVLEVQYFCLWMHYDNLWKKKPIKNLFSLICEKRP